MLMSSGHTHQASFNTLPLELVEEITKYLLNDDFSSLITTNRDFHGCLEKERLKRREEQLRWREELAYHQEVMSIFGENRYGGK
jgi:hypothetical protein